MIGIISKSKVMMCCWDVNRGWWFDLYKRTCIHYLGVGKALFLYVGQRAISNSSSRRPCFSSWTSKVDSIWSMWLLFISKRHVGFALLRAKHFFTFHVEHMSAKLGNSVHLCHSVVEHLDVTILHHLLISLEEKHVKVSVILVTSNCFMLQKHQI
jgi:hypothetical protein